MNNSIHKCIVIFDKLVQMFKGLRDLDILVHELYAVLWVQKMILQGLLIYACNILVDLQGTTTNSETLSAA